MFSQLKSMSFKTRILLGFCTIIVMMIGIIGTGMMNLWKIQHDVSEISDTFLPRALLAQNMAFNVVQVQQFLTDVSATTDSAGYQEAEQSAQAFKEGINQLRNHAGHDAVQLKAIEELGLAFDNFYSEGKRMAAAYISQGKDAGNIIMENFDKMSLDLAAEMNKIKDGGVKDVTNHSASLTLSTWQEARMMLWISIMIVTLSLFIAIYLTRYLSRLLGIDPLYASGIAKEIAKGNFSRDIRLESGDTNSLLHAMKMMQGSIQAFVAAQSEMAQKHADGWIWEQIDASKFRGTYATMAQDINTLVRSHIDVKMQVVDVISRYAQGDFSVDMPRLPGDKAKITEAIDSVKHTIV